jgi:hypothetical protein
MKIKSLISTLILSAACASTQHVTTSITEGDVIRVLKTLSSDAMRGRSALTTDIEAATAFIENEFAKIGLQPMEGLAGFRQQFRKDRIGPLNVEVVVNGTSIPEDNVIIISDNEQFEASGGLPVVSLTYDSSINNTTQHFFRKAYPFMMDSSSAIMVVAPEYRDAFIEFKGYFEKHFTNNRNNSKVYILGDQAIETYSVEVDQRIETIVMNNVVGVLPGKARPDEIVLFSAHYDHIGILPAVQGDSIANGADDDASGTTAVIELARHFKKQNNNNRTLMFVAFTAEEIGGYGSQYFSRQLDPEDIVAMLNIEMIGKPSKWGRDAAFVTGYERSDLGTVLEKNVQGTGFSFRADPYPEQDLFYRSDFG